VAKTCDTPKTKIACMNQNSLSVLAGLSPIVLGATGHRDIAEGDYSVLKKAISDELKKIAYQCVHSPLVLLSGLAEGADRLVAMSALECGWHISAILPLPQDEYEKDFSSQASVEEFRNLLSHCVWIKSLGDKYGRPECYRQMGFELAKQSQLLISVWDGHLENGPGGTAEVIRCFRQGLPNTRPQLPDAGPVIHVLARRSEHVNIALKKGVGFVELLAPCPAGLANVGEELRWSVVLNAIDSFNAEVLKAKKNNINFGKEGWLIKPVWFSDASSYSKEHLARNLFLTADELSIKAQIQREFLFCGLMSLGALSVLILQIYANLFFLSILLIAALGLSAVGTVWYMLAEQKNIEGQYLDTRALAEACRVQYFWKILNLPDNASEFFLRSQRDELEWIRQAVKTTELGLEVNTSVAMLTRLQFVRDAWIENQLNYFSGKNGQVGKAEFNRQADANWRKRGSFFFALGIGLAFATAIFHRLNSDLSNLNHGWYMQCLLFGFYVSFATSGLIKVYREIKAFAEHAKFYDRMQFALQLTLHRLDAAIKDANITLAIELIKELGQEALTENGNWLLMHRERPILVRGIF